MAFTTPPSPRWNDSDIDYPNISQATDAVTCKEWRNDVLDYINYIHTHCKCRYGNFYYGKFIEKSGKRITFHREFETSKDIFKIKEIKLLVLANGKTIVRDRKTFLPIFFGISVYFIFYFSLLLNI